MKKLFAVLLILGWAGAALADEEKSLVTKISSLGLFKNGLAVVQRTAKIEGPGVYRVDDVPEPVYGTYWVESDAVVTTRVTQRLMDVPLEKAAPGNFQTDLAGRDVVIHFAEQGTSPMEGTVLAVDPPRGSAAWGRRYEQPEYGYGYSTAPAGSAPAVRFLLLKTKDGQAYVDSSKIAYLEAKGKATSIRQRKPVLLFTVSDMKQPGAAISISYLTKGIAWSPSYRVDISDKKKLSIQQGAVVKNELEPFAGVELRLITGYPSMEFSHVTSPLSPAVTWTQFFQQLNQRVGTGRSAVVSQQYVASNSMAPNQAIDLTAAPTGEGVDLYYQGIGRQTLDEGDSLALETASAKADYQRIVEWIIPDTRQANGRYIQDYERQNNPDKYQDAVWDAVQFRNPFSFPMTTAPAMFVSDGKFNGQQTSFFVSPGEETTLHVTKSLNVRSRSVEHEVEPGRDIVYLGGLAFRKTTLEGTVTANNHRNEQITLVIRRRFSGDLVSADKEPKLMLLEEGAGYVNKRNQLTWTFTLKPGEEINLTYRYTLLVQN